MESRVQGGQHSTRHPGLRSVGSFRAQQIKLSHCAPAPAPGSSEMFTLLDHAAAANDADED